MPEGASNMGQELHNFLALLLYTLLHQIIFVAASFVSGTGSSGQNEQAGRGGWALPSTERVQQSGRVMPYTGDWAGSSSGQYSTRIKGSAGFKDKSSQSHGKRRN